MIIRMKQITVNTCKQYIYIMYINIYSTNDLHVMVITDCSHFLGHIPLIRCLRWPIKATLLSQSRRTGDQWEPKSAQKLFSGIGIC